MNLPSRGDAFLVPTSTGFGFGCVLAVNSDRHVALVAMQNGSVGEMPLNSLMAFMLELEQATIEVPA